MKISKEMHVQACSVSLPNYLLTRHSDKVSILKNDKSAVVLNSDHNVSVKNVEDWHGYIDWASGDKGNNIDYLIKYLGYDYVSAVTDLLNFDGKRIENFDDYVVESRRVITSKEIELPKQKEYCANKQITMYLESRGVSIFTIDKLIKKGLLYQAEQCNNAVFVNKDRDYAEIRGTLSYAEMRCKFRKECESYIRGYHDKCERTDECANYKKDVFHGCRKATSDAYWCFEPEGESEIAYICEAAIDAISLYDIHTNTGVSTKASYISIGGVSNQQTIDRIKQNKKVIIAVDNDEAGQKCRERNQDCENLIPTYKDWNEDLMKIFHGQLY